MFLNRICIHLLGKVFCFVTTCHFKCLYKWVFLHMYLCPCRASCLLSEDLVQLWAGQGTAQYLSKILSTTWPKWERTLLITGESHGGANLSLLVWDANLFKYFSTEQKMTVRQHIINRLWPCIVPCFVSLRESVHMIRDICFFSQTQYIAVFFLSSSHSVEPGQNNNNNSMLPVPFIGELTL